MKTTKKVVREQITTKASKKQKSLNEKIEVLIEKTSNDLLEREEIVRMAYLGLLSGESVFLLGPPGTAKSLLSRKMKEAIKDASSFEYLMNKFSTPEEIFGPISLTKLDEDKFERKIEGYLPTANIGFLDEIWKASPAIQNTLLTIINEKLFRNGTNDVKVPLDLLIAASNEMPQEGEGLEALYDRFLIRLYVGNTKKVDSFNKLILAGETSNNDILDSEKLTVNELAEFRKNLHEIKVDKPTLDFIDLLRKKLHLDLKENAPYLSDRRWKKIIKILRASAKASGRDYVSSADLLIIPNLIWESEEQRVEIEKLFMSIWSSTLVSKCGSNFAVIKSKVDKLDAKKPSAYLEAKKLFKEIVNISDGIENIVNDILEEDSIFVTDFKYHADLGAAKIEDSINEIEDKVLSIQAKTIPTYKRGVVNEVVKPEVIGPDSKISSVFWKDSDILFKLQRRGIQTINDLVRVNPTGNSSVFRTKYNMSADECNTIVSKLKGIRID